MKKIFTLSICLTALSIALFAQEGSPVMNYGIKAGATYSSMTNLETTILSEPYFLYYSLSKKERLGWTAGLFLNYRFMPILALEGAIMYSQQGSDLVFHNYQMDFNYKMQFAYQYINVCGLIKLYPFGNMENAMEGLHVGLGPQLGLNIAPQNIIYHSWGTGKLPAFGPDLLQQQQLRNVLKGKNNFGFNFGLGYEFSKLGLTVDARYYYGISDVVETQSNSYNFIENKNTNKAFQLCLGWDFSKFKNL